MAITLMWVTEFEVEILPELMSCYPPRYSPTLQSQGCWSPRTKLCSDCPLMEFLVLLLSSRQRILAVQWHQPNYSIFLTVICYIHHACLTLTHLQSGLFEAKGCTEKPHILFRGDEWTPFLFVMRPIKANNGYRKLF